MPSSRGKAEAPGLGKAQPGLDDRSASAMGRSQKGRSPPHIEMRALLFFWIAWKGSGEVSAAQVLNHAHTHWVLCFRRLYLRPALQCDSFKALVSRT